MGFLVLMYGWARSFKLAVRRLRSNRDADDAVCGDTTAASPDGTALVQVQLGEIITKIF